MKRVFGLSVLMMAAALLSGCCFSEVYLDEAPKDCIAPEGYEAVAYGAAVNDGFYLFNSIPLRSGNMYRPNTHDYSSFDDYANQECNSTMLLDVMHKAFRAEELYQVSHTETAIGWPTLWIVWRRYIRTEAIGIRKK